MSPGIASPGVLQRGVKTEPAKQQQPITKTEPHFSCCFVMLIVVEITHITYSFIGMEM